ncbi:MAG: PDZ domain-containing protein [Gemmatimonadaceae bacterium]
MRTLVMLASALVVGGTLEAQATAQGRARTAEQAQRAEEAATVLRKGVMQRFMVADSAMQNRATLGLMLGGSPTKRDTLGVFVDGVAEDGPAERAGIYEGHRIAFINNVDVRASAGDAGDPYLSSVGQHRLMRVMRDVTAGSTVTLRVWTGSGYRDVQVTTAKYADVFKNQRLGGMFQPGVQGSFGFGPALEALRREGPNIYRMELRPSDVRRIEVRPTPRVPATRVAPTPRAPLRISVPAVSPSVTPRVLSRPRIAPTPASRRRFVI